MSVVFTLQRDSELSFQTRQKSFVPLCGKKEKGGRP